MSCFHGNCVKYHIVGIMHVLLPMTYSSVLSCYLCHDCVITSLFRFVRWTVVSCAVCVLLCRTLASTMRACPT